MSHDSRDALPLLLTVEQVAELLQLHPETIRLQIRQGRLPARKYGKSWRVLRDDILAPATPNSTPPSPRKPSTGARSDASTATPADYVTHAEAARLLGCSRATISRMIDRGDLAAEPAGPRGGARRLRRATILAQLASRRGE